ncbi:MAG: hypothetical protein PVS2B3_07500 [Steroidobacteraceae bacterium]
MKKALALLPLLLAARAFAGDAPAVTTGVASEPAHRYLIERTFPAGALDGLDAALKARINTTNSRYGVHWVMSYANAQKTRTYCIYEAPSEQAVREAARANNIPVDSVTEVPVTLTP